MRTTALALCLLLLQACGDSKSDPAAGPALDQGHIQVDHILIGVNHARNPSGKYTQEEARKLAYDLMDQLKNGADWAALKKKHSEDPPPGGPYALADHGVAVKYPDELERGFMVGAFGDVGFTLAVGEIGMADFHPRQSPYGFHIIKRVK